MKKFICVFLSVLLSACASNLNTSAPVIVADGTEVEQFEDLFFCGDADRFSIALGTIGQELGAAWDKKFGKSSN